MTHNTPLLQSLRKRTEIAKDLVFSILIIACFCIIWQQPTATYLNDTTIQAFRRAVTPHITSREATSNIHDTATASAYTPQPDAVANEQNETRTTTLSSWLSSISTQQHPAVLVTALYDIGREKHGRSMEQYKQWFAHTLKIASPMVVFIGDPKLVDFVKDHCQGLPTHIEQRPLKQVYYSKLGPWVAAVQQSQQWKQCVGYSGRLERVLPHYITITWAKVGLLNEVAGQAAPSSEVSQGYFAWIDAGAGRWTTSAEGKIWPNLQQLQLRDPAGDRLIAEASPTVSSTSNIKSFLCGSGDGVMGAALLAKASTWQRLHQNFNSLVYDELLPNSWIGNEQMLFKILLDRNVTQMSLVPPTCPPKGCGSGNDSAMAIIDWLG